EADRDRGEDREEPGGDQLTKRVLGADVDDARVLRLFRAVHDSGTSTELFANLHDDTSGSTSDRHDRKSGEEEHHACADDDTDEDIGVVQREREQFVVSELLLHGGTEGTE